MKECRGEGCCREVLEKSVVENCCREECCREVLEKSVVEKCCRGVLEETVGEEWWRRVL